MATQGRYKNGEVAFLENGRWRDATQSEYDVLNEPMLSAFSRSAVSLLGTVGGLIAMPGNPAAGDAMRSHLETAQQMSELRPGAMGAAELGLEALVGLGAAAKSTRAARRATTAQQTARRGPAQALQEGTVQPLTENTQIVDDMGALIADVRQNVSTAGAMENPGSLFQSLKRMPKFRGTLESLEDFIGMQRPMNATRRSMLDNGDPERVGLELLPGQSRGNDVISEVIRRDPLMQDAFDGPLSRNSDRLLGRASQSMGLEPGDYGRDIRELGRARVGGMFDEVEANINSVSVTDESLQGVIQETMTPMQRELIDLADMDGALTMEVRRAINDQLAASSRLNGAEAVETRALREAAEQFDDLIENGMTDPVAMELWREARQRWRVVRAFDRQGVITPDGDISVKSLVNALEREFEREFRRRTFAPEGMHPDIANLLDYARVARTFMSNLNDSGTATGNSLLGALNSPGQFAKKRVVANFVAEALLNNPVSPSPQSSVPARIQRPSRLATVNTQ